MSPVPPNKELSKSFASSPEAPIEPEVNLTGVNLVEEAAQAEADAANENGQATASHVYEPLPQQDIGLEAHGSQANDEDDEDDDDDDEDDDDSDVEINEDLDFEMLANSRAFQKPKSSAGGDSGQPQGLPSTTYTFESDYFERKTMLECEEIKLDEARSQTINNLMSGFKLPESSIPDWAKAVPENVWKKNLLETINAKKTDLFNDIKQIDE
jgi:hypothetical protein